MFTFPNYTVLLVIFIISIISQPVRAQQFVSEETWVQYPVLSSSCAAALNTTLKCDISLLIADSPSGEYLSNDQLTSLCTDTCKGSLRNYRDTLLSSCSNSDLISNGNLEYLASYQADYYLTTLEIACRKDRDTDKFCGDIFLTWPEGTSTSAQECSDCLLGIQQLQLNSPFMYRSKFELEYKSTTSSCQNMNYPYTSPTLNLVSSTPTTATSTAISTVVAPKSCNTLYAIQAKDSCTSISLAKKVSTFSLLLENNLEAYCQNFPTSGQICIPPQCEIHTVLAGETCKDILSASSTSISVFDLRTWNPNINVPCDNIYQLVGTQICIGAPIGQEATTSTQTDAAGTTTSTFITATNVSPVKYWASDEEYSYTYTPISTTTTLLPLASGTPADCLEYIEYEYLNWRVDDWTEEDKAGAQDVEVLINSCDIIARKAGIRIKVLISQNPSLPYISTCRLQIGYRYCFHKN